MTDSPFVVFFGEPEMTRVFYYDSNFGASVTVEMRGWNAGCSFALKTDPGFASKIDPPRTR
jgi:hypothetical protein